MRPKTRRVPLSLLALAVGAIAAGAPRPAAAAEARSITLEQVQPAAPSEAGTVTVAVAGKTDLPPGARLVARIGLAGAKAGVYRKGDVTAEGTFAIELTIDRKVLPAEYTVSVAFERREQTPQVSEAVGRGTRVEPAERRVRIGGDAAAEREARRALAARYGALHEAARTAYIDAVTAGEYYRHAVRPGRGKVLQAAAGAWLGHAKATLSGPIAKLSAEASRIEEEVFVSYFPEAHRAIENIAYMIPRLIAAYGVDVYRLAGLPDVPVEIRTLRQYDVLTCQQQITKRADEVARALEAEARDWTPASQSLADDATIEGELYRSARAGFEIARPSNRWVFQTIARNPILRLRIAPADPERDAVMVNVVTLGFPLAADQAGLVESVKGWAAQRWPGHEVVSEREVTAQDGAMPDGVRHGYEMTVEATVGAAEVRGHVYCLFGRDGHRVHALVASMPAAEADAVGAELPAAISRFKVLDGGE